MSSAAIASTSFHEANGWIGHATSCSRGGAGPAAALSRGKKERGDRKAGPAAGCLRREPVAPFPCDTNTCTLDRVQLAGIPIIDKDVFKLARVLRTGGFEDVAGTLTHALLIETKVVALTVTDREPILWALDEPPTHALAELRACSCVSTSGGCGRGSFSRVELISPHGAPAADAESWALLPAKEAGNGTDRCEYGDLEAGGGRFRICDRPHQTV